jgi:lipopolysaccharide export LptBFGC system permease protein LptF
LITGLITAILFFLIDKNLLPDTIIARKSILHKLENNKQKELQLQAELESIVAIHDAWSFTAFPDSDVTFAEYIGLLKEKSSIEYSESEFEKLKKGDLNRKELVEYSYRLKNQEEAAVALQADIDFQKENLTMLSGIAAAC